jgi:hypothetical protein
MPFRHPSTPATRRTVASRSLGCWSVAGVLVAASLALTACGSSGSAAGSSESAASSSGTAVSFSASRILLNTRKIELAIEQSSLEQRGKHVKVSCPAGVHQQKGLVFFCTAVYSGGRTQFAVTELDGSGDVHYVAR